MTTQTTDFPIGVLTRIVRDNAAGLSAAAIAAALQSEGIPVPRWTGVPTSSTTAAEYVAASSATATGYNLPTHPGDPSRWNAASITAVLATAQAVTTNGYAAAKAVVPSETVTRLAV